MKRLLICVVGAVILPVIIGGVVNSEDRPIPLQANQAPSPPNQPHQPPADVPLPPPGPPKPGCIPADPNPGPYGPLVWYCDGPPPPPPTDPYFEAMLEFVKQRHADFPVVTEDGRPIMIGNIPVAYQREYIKSVNPDAVFDVDGISVDELSAILDRHPEIMEIIGFAGSGIDKDGICIHVTEPHGVFPTELEGARIHLRPALLGQDLGS
jgi:hypothetical protein